MMADSILYISGLVLLSIFVAFLKPVDDLLYAQSSHQKLRIDYDDRLLSISTKDADIKNVLLELADKADIYVSFPESIKKKISIETTKITLKKALQKVLKGLNYAIIYSGSNRNEASISKVIVFKKSTMDRRASRSNMRIANRIKAYEKRIESLKGRLSKIDSSSRRGKNYLRQIERLENNIEKLSRQLY
jgi:DNA polymerase/3'-5' exonuclease PolX